MRCLVLIAMLVAAGCSDSADGSVTIVEGGEPVCEGGPRVPTIRVTHEVATTSELPNVIRGVGDGQFAVVESGTNSVSLWDGEALRRLVDLPTSRNPYDVTRSGDSLWVTNFLSDSAAVVDLESGAFTEIESDSLDDPSGIARLGDRIYVSNIAFTAPTEPYGDGSVTIFDAATQTEIETLPTAAKNPIFMRTFGAGTDEFLVVSASGELFLSDDGAGVATPGAVEIWREAEDDLERSVFNLPQVESRQIGAPGRPLLAPNGHLYFASGTAPILFELDPDDDWVHGADDPLRFAPIGGDSLHHAAMSERGVILVTSFNRDGLFLWDTTCNKPMNAEPIDLGTTTLLEGPHGIEIESEEGDTTTALFIMNLSNVLGRVELDWGE